MRGVLILIQPIDPATGSRIPIRCGQSKNSRTLAADGAVWHSAITRAPKISMEFVDDNLVAQIQLGRGTATINTARINGLTRTYIDSLIWIGSPISIWSGDGATTADMTAEFVGTVRTGSIDKANRQLQLSFEVDRKLIDVPLLNIEYGGGGGADGDVEIRGQLKPACFGSPVNVPVFFFDQVKNIGQVDAYGNITAIDNLYENAAAFGTKLANYASYALLAAATIPAGSWATCVAEGMIRLGAPPKGVITCDPVAGAGTPGAMMLRWLQTHGGVSAGRINALSFTALDEDLFALFGHTPAVSYYNQSQANIAERIQVMCASCNAVPLLMPDGKIGVARVPAGSTVAIFPTANLLAAQPDPNGTGWTHSSGAPYFFDTPWHVIGDNDANYDSWNNANLACTNGANNTFMVRVRKDSIGSATRFPLFRLAGGMTASPAEVCLDTATGAFLKSGLTSTLWSAGVVDQTDHWVLWMTITATATGTGQLQIYPSIGAGSTPAVANWNTATTGSIAVRGFQWFYGDFSYTPATPAAPPPAFTLNRFGGNPIVLDWKTGDAPTPWWRLKMAAEITVRVNGPNEIDYEDDLVDLGDYLTGRQYRIGNIVRLSSDGRRYLYTNPIPSTFGPPNVTYWTVYENAVDATVVKYADGTPIETLRPAEPGATQDGGGLNELSDTSFTGWALSGGVVRQAKGATNGFAIGNQPWTVELVPGTAIRTAIGPLVSTMPGQPYFFSADVARNAGVNAAAVLNVGGDWLNALGATISAANPEMAPQNTTTLTAGAIPVQIRWSQVAPVGAVYFRPRISLPAVTAPQAGGAFRVEYPRVSAVEFAADVSRQVTTAEPNPRTFNYTYTGVLDPSSQMPATLEFKLVVQNAVVTSGVTWVATVKSGTINGVTTGGNITMTGTGTGSLPVTSLSADAVVEIKATQAGAATPAILLQGFKRSEGTPPVTPPTGGTAGTLASKTSSFNSFSGTGSYVDVTGTINFTTPAGVSSVNITTALGLAIGVRGTGGATTSQFKLQRLISSTWTDILTGFNDDVDSTTYFDPDSGTVVFEDGNVNNTQTLSGLSGGTAYAVRLVAKNATNAVRRIDPYAATAGFLVVSP